MKKYTRDMVRRRKRRINDRLRDRRWKPQEKPMLSGHLSIILCLGGGRNNTYKAVRPALTCWKIATE